ncbi:sigma factor-like helix-turn-helix DNA-binding protein [Mesorhizobium sp. RCC_202]|uniref:sigma factor-like helix-turn-helix DNA-binding protein n=1 Tax=Mesorhizobium sp. RCC_202 TaxID=3239222 RepID=UPI003523DF94
MAEHRRQPELFDPDTQKQIQPSTQSARSSPSGDAAQTNLVDLVPALRAFARSLRGSLEEADDLVRETLIKGMAGLYDIEESHVKPWLFATMRTTYLAKLGDAASQHDRTSGCLSQSLAGNAQAGTRDGREMARAMDRLPAPERHAAVLVCMIGLSYEDAAAICDCDATTIKGRIQDARTRLAAMLDTSTTSSKPN